VTPGPSRAAIVTSLRTLEEAHDAAVEAGDLRRARSLARTIGDTRASLERFASTKSATMGKASKADALARQVTGLLKQGVLPKQIPDHLPKQANGKPVSDSTVRRAIVHARELRILPPGRSRKIL